MNKKAKPVDMGTFSCLANVSVRRWISGAACLGVLLLIGVADLIDVGVFIGPNGLVSSPFGSSKTTDAVFSPMDEQHDWTPLRKSGSLADQFIAQRSQWGWRGRRSYRGDYRDMGRNGVPEWKVDENYPGDLFTFARVKYGSRGGWGKWATDFRDSDLNFSLRLHQLTTLKVNPEPVVVELTDENLLDYPFLYMIEPGDLYFEEPEVLALRKYCFNGGFLMVDDFWGDDQYRNLERQLARVFPDRKATEVPLEHEIFHNVYDLKEKPQIPAIGQARRRSDGTIETWERSWNNDTRVPHYRAIYDDADRIMVFICHNTDLGDGWEREGEDQWYFEEFSVKKAYPLGINIVTYAMTH